MEKEKRKEKMSENWKHLRYGLDEYGKEIIWDKNNFQVMMEWEKPYMESCIQNLQPNGKVLEIGFGMGYSADEIQKYNIESHTIIESDPIVLIKLREWAKNQKNRVIIVEGTWQDKLDQLGKYDSVFMDDAPNDAYTDKTTLRIYQFYDKLSKYHVNEGARFSWYMDRELPFMIDVDSSYDCKQFIATIPDNAKYIPEQTHETGTLYMPVITFKKGSKENIITIGIDRNYNPVLVKQK